MVPDFLDIDRQVLMDVNMMSYGSKYTTARLRHDKGFDVVWVRSDAVHKCIHTNLDEIFNDWIPSSDNPVPFQQRLQGSSRIRDW